MIYRTGYLLKTTGTDRYIQVETVLEFYEQKFINTGKHLLFEEENYIGDITTANNEWTCTGLAGFTEADKHEIISFLKVLKVPLQESSSPEFGFGIELNKNITYCEIMSANNLYEVWFDGEKVARLEQDSSRNWVQVLGKPIPASTLIEISKRIEDHYY